MEDLLGDVDGRDDGQSEGDWLGDAEKSAKDLEDGTAEDFVDDNVDGRSEGDRLGDADESAKDLEDGAAEDFLDDTADLSVPMTSTQDSIAWFASGELTGVILLSLRCYCHSLI
jgi:hypothetical protein